MLEGGSFSGGGLITGSIFCRQVGGPINRKVGLKVEGGLINGRGAYKWKRGL